MPAYFVPDPETGYVDAPAPRGPQIPRDCVQCERVLSENGGPIQYGALTLCRECAQWYADKHALALEQKIAADQLEERENFRTFAATLPMLGDCAFYCDYLPARMGEIENGIECSMIRNGTRYVGHGSSEAAAYGRMIQQIVEREA
jgi:hypothetical protein